MKLKMFLKRSEETRNSVKALLKTAQHLQDTKEAQEKITKADRGGEFIFLAGSLWDNFDYKRGFEDLLKKDRKGMNIEFAGASPKWRNGFFDNERALDVLERIDKKGGIIYSAGNDWSGFNYKRGLEILKKKAYFYNIALKKWPMNYDGTKKAIQKQKENSKPMPEKKFKL
jgi:hypothetical protein